LELKSGGKIDSQEQCPQRHRPENHGLGANKKSLKRCFERIGKYRHIRQRPENSRALELKTRGKIDSQGEKHTKT
jgi:hypothetical protein